MPADYKAQIDERGRLKPTTIPQNEREHEGIKEGDWVQVSIRKLRSPDEKIDENALDIARSLTDFVNVGVFNDMDKDIVTILQGVRNFISGGLQGLEAMVIDERKPRYVCSAWANDLESWVMVTKSTESEAMEWVEEKKHLPNFVTSVPSGFYISDDLLQDREAFYSFMSDNFAIVKSLGVEDVTDTAQVPEQTEESEEVSVSGDGDASD